ncbi:hypothetical protein [Nitrosomonas sp. Nm33]|uniref:hypothetical protein n=1 Tax=Nitrosomonas sp. Nm33 TaxID=133724 RepID=UPI0008983B30|nr:hypothetical protein [Nitrosomonas sp. Nm33]SDY12612.1 hypothetical protein SAMN05421755_100836 [Nitrosomonas sp. Nm33]
MKYLLFNTTNRALRFIGIGYEWSAKFAVLLCLLLISFSAQAESAIDEQIRQLESELLQIHQNQQNVYQQFQMTQELRRHELQQQEEVATIPPMGTYPPTGTFPELGTAKMSEFLPEVTIGGSPPSYEEMVRKKQERQKRIRQYTSDLDRLRTQYQELETEKKTLMEQIADLKQSKQSELTR